MSLAQTKVDFEQLIDDRNNGVVALSGTWGTGKSHLWRQVQEESINDAIKKALYVSLFGVKDILQLKLRVVQSAIPDSKTGHVVREVVTSAVRQAIKFAKGFNSAFSALDEIALLAVPAILRNRLIVLDDIERKHKDLNIEEVMGFIDEFTQMYGARVVLILNDDQLEDKDMWDKLREKVIDHELSLETTPEEACDIALKNVPSPHGALIHEAIKTCKVNNIRIIQKMIRVVGRLLSVRTELDEDVLRRVVPSTALLAAIHYKGLQEGPDFDYVLKFNSMAYQMRQVGKKKALGEETDEDRAEAKWNQLMGDLGINSADEYEELVVDFLKSGLVDTAKTRTILDRYVAEKETFAVQARSREFFDKSLWHPECSDDDLLADANALATPARLLGAYDVTALHAGMSEIPGGQAVADRMVADWLAHFRQNAPTEFKHSNFFKQQLHPDIEAEFMALHARLNPTPSLFDACIQLIDNSGWGEGQAEAMRAATPASFEEEIVSRSGVDLRRFMLKNMDLYVHRETYQKHFGESAWNFVAACRSICHANANPRRSRMIQLVFSESKMASILDIYDCPQPEEAAPARAA
ncbi:MAG: NTPase KAP [Burkholderiaceae bacterium]|nr:NTPase KAP [Burkholderiaceae bacterium]